MIKKHKKSAVVVASVFLGAGAWAQLSNNDFLQFLASPSSVAAPLASTVELTAPAFSASVSAAELPVLVAQASTQPLPSSGSAVSAPAGQTPGFSAGMSPEALQAEIAAQVAQGKDLATVLAAARTAGVPDVVFVAAAAKAGVTVAAITTAVISASTDTAVALRTLGLAFTGDQVALESVLATAITISTVALSPAAVESSIESGCGRDCLAAPAVVAQTAPETATAPAPTPAATTTSSSVGGGGGSGGSAPASPS